MPTSAASAAYANDVAFSGPTHILTQELAERDSSQEWWPNNRPRVAGWLRMVSHSMVIASGLGVGTIGSGFRILTGVLGFAGACFLGMFGGKKAPPQTKEALEACVGEHCPEANGVARSYYAILTLSALSLIASGLMTGRVTEMVAGMWTATWCAVGALAPEGKETSPPPLLSAEESWGAWMQRKYAEYCESPKKLASDMLQFSAAFVLADGIHNGDVARIISGACLGASNYAARTLRDDAPETKGRSL